MSYPALSVLVQFNKTPKTQDCPIDLTTLQWGFLSDNVIYGNFQLPDNKYINYTVTNHFEYGKDWLLIGCQPNIFGKSPTGEIVDLREYNYDQYFKHEEYWKVDLMLEIPKDGHIFAKEISALKYEYDVFAVYFKSDYSQVGEFHDRFSKMKKTDVVGYYYNPTTQEVDLEHEGYCDVLGEILKSFETDQKEE
jgi:hypothetical protein